MLSPPSWPCPRRVWWEESGPWCLQWGPLGPSSQGACSSSPVSRVEGPRSSPAGKCCRGLRALGSRRSPGHGPPLALLPADQQPARKVPGPLGEERRGRTPPPPTAHTHTRSIGRTQEHRGGAGGWPGSRWAEAECARGSSSAWVHLLEHRRCPRARPYTDLTCCWDGWW